MAQQDKTKTDAGIDRYNDYCIVTEGYLENYSSLLTALVNLKDLLGDRKAELAAVRDAAPPAQQLGQVVLFGGGPEKLTQPEAVYEKSRLLEEDIKFIEADIKRMESLIRRLNTAKIHLHPELKRLVELRYVDEKSWDIVADEIKYSERWCRELKDQAVEKIAIALFGTRAMKKKSKERMKFLG